MKRQVLSGLSALAILAGAGVALAQEKGPAAPSAAPGANSGNGDATMEKGGGNPGASERSAPGAADHGTSAGKSEAARHEKGADKGGDKAPGKDKAPTQASEKDQRGTSTAKKDPDSSKDRAKESKELSSGAASGEAGKANATTEGRNDTSTRSHVSLNGEQRTRVQSAFKSHRGSAKADVNIQVRVGVAVPRTITLYEVPEDVVIIVPEWRRYKYVLIGDEICIIDPDTYEIIDVIAAV